MKPKCILLSLGLLLAATQAQAGPLPASSGTTVPDGRGTVASPKTAGAGPIAQPWRTTDDIIPGWDWSLPPDVRASPRGWLAYGSDEDLTTPFPPGNRVIALHLRWRDLEPRDGEFDFTAARARIARIAAAGLGVNLTILGAVWRFDKTDRQGNVTAPSNGSDPRESAPRWLADLGVPLIQEKAITNNVSPFQITNCDIFHPLYHERYLRFIRALGQSGLPALAAVKVAYLCDKSATNGEEGWTAADQPTSGEGWQRYRERLAAWAEAFGAKSHVLMTVSSKPQYLEECYLLGIGQRNGFVEMYLGHVDNAAMGQSVDAEGYLLTDENCPPLARGYAWGDENEEYSRGWTARFGPYETFGHRYRESMLRALQMRRNYLRTDRSDLDPALLHYVCLELGRTVEDTPDAWCYLRETPTHEHPQGVRNFERWLQQRDRDGARTVAVDRYDIEKQNSHSHDFTARRTDVARGQTKIGFALDDRFLPGGPHRVAFKVTYRDEGDAVWRLVYDAARPDSPPARVRCTGTGEIRTATFFRDDVRFGATGLDFDFAIESERGDAVIKFVRVVRLQHAGGGGDRPQ
ncbi:MAG: hypothetical protein PSV13_08050 [Lacunisphaera sp.]|nr:hypothetical protein [Lacunisphaera sp.]